MNNISAKSEKKLREMISEEAVLAKLDKAVEKFATSYEPEMALKVLFSLQIPSHPYYGKNLTNLELDGGYPQEVIMVFLTESRKVWEKVNGKFIMSENDAANFLKVAAQRFVSGKKEMNENIMYLFIFSKVAEFVLTATLEELDRVQYLLRSSKPENAFGGLRAMHLCVEECKLIQPEGSDLSFNKDIAETIRMLVEEKQTSTVPEVTAFKAAFEKAMASNLDLSMNIARVLGEPKAIAGAEVSDSDSGEPETVAEAEVSDEVSDSGEPETVAEAEVSDEVSDSGEPENVADVEMSFSEKLNLLLEVRDYMNRVAASLNVSSKELAEMVAKL